MSKFGKVLTREQMKNVVGGNVVPATMCTYWDSDGSGVSGPVTAPPGSGMTDVEFAQAACDHDPNCLSVECHES